MKQKAILLIVVVILIALTAQYLRQRVIPVKVPNTKVGSPVPDAPLNSMAKKIGLKQMYLVRDRESVYLDVRIVVVNQCGAGDLDAMKQEFQREKNKRHLLSLEPLGATSGVAPASLEITPEQIMQGVSHQFKIPVGKKLSLGVFLCKDAAKTGTCLGKPAVDINVLLNHYLHDDTTFEPEPADKTYFFQYLRITDNGFLEAFEDVPKKTVFADLEQYAAGDSTPSDAKKAIGIAADRTNTLRSLPVGFRQEVVIPLPVYDETTCPKFPKAK